MVRIDNRIDIKITATGAQIAAYTLNYDKVYYSQKDNKLHAAQGTTRKKNLETP